MFCDAVFWTPGGHDLRLDWSAVDPGDHVRVLVAIPEPPSCLMLGLGLFELGLSCTAAAAEGPRAPPGATCVVQSADCPAPPMPCSSSTSSADLCRTPVFSGVDLQVAAGEIRRHRRESGVGKVDPLLDCIAGLDTVDGGSVAGRRR